MNKTFIDAKTNAMVCHSCGASEPLNLPAPVTAVVERALAFEREHKNHKPLKLIGDACHRCRAGEFCFRGVREWVHGSFGNRVRCEASDLRDLHLGATPTPGVTL